MTTKTNKELLESCKTHLEYGIDDIVTPIMDDFQELFTRFEKQIPKKPKTLTEEYYKTYTFECECGFKAKTNCTQSIEVRDLDYCPCCGQAIDWSGFYDD